MIRLRVLALLVAAAVAAAALAACEKIDRNMWQSPAFRPQEEPVRLPPAGSVPTKGIARVPATGTEAAAALRNPEKIGDSALVAGKELYGIFCAPCHGESGKGDGPVAKKFVPTPADISAGGLGPQYAEGELFAVITHGKNGMPAFQGDLAPRERWLVVAYLGTLK